MDSLSSAIKKCNLDLLLDNPTEGFGNCFPNALVQQCRRPEIKTWLQKYRPWAIFNGHQSVRTKITNFALKSRDQVIANLKTKYEQEIGPAENRTWEGYWNYMGRDGSIAIIKTREKDLTGYMCLRLLTKNERKAGVI